MLLECNPVGDWQADLSLMTPWILQRYPKWKTWPPGHCYPREYAWVLQQLGDVKGHRILDAGGGGSVLSAVLSDKGVKEIVVADHDPNPYTRIRVTCHPCDIQDTQLEDASFDTVVSVSAIEHNPWDKQVAIIRHLLGLVRPGQTLLVTLPAVPTDQRAWHENYRGWGCVYFWTHAAAREMCQAVSDLATLDVPLLPDADYDAEWQRIQGDVLRATTVPWKYPYQSMVLKWRRSP